MKMVRKQMYITAELDEKLKRLAQARDQTEAEVVRQALEQIDEVNYDIGQHGAGTGRVREAAAVMDRYVADDRGGEEAGSVRTFAGRRLDESAWAEEVAFIRNLARTTKGTTDRFDRNELYKDRESKLLR